MQISEVSCIARAAVADGSNHPDVIALGKVGSSGLHACHSWRDFKRTHLQTPMCNAIGRSRIPLTPSNGGRVNRDQVSLFYPHKLFAALYNNYPEAFAKHMLGGGIANVDGFWGATTDHPAYAAHPMHVYGLNDFRRCAILFKIYGDGTLGTGVGKAWCKPADAITLSSLLGERGHSWHSNYILAMLHEVFMYVDGDGFHATEDAFGFHSCGRCIGYMQAYGQTEGQIIYPTPHTMVITSNWPVDSVRAGFSNWFV